MPNLEAASARYVARDRFSFPGEPAATPLQRYIQNACDPQNFEPNLALCLEIADLINSKKGNAPREAAVAIVNYINHRNQNVSLLALALLDICVKNCGYPFHLQISTKEFLNELVRRFPERPPVRPTRSMNRILELIEEWRSTICQTSKYKDDLGFIRDMHRLLSYKGYVFPEVRREDAAVLNPSDVSAPLYRLYIARLTFSAEPQIRRRDGSRRACGTVSQASRAHSSWHPARLTRSEQVDEGHGGI